jgi:hypothetical protein
VGKVVFFKKPFGDTNQVLQSRIDEMTGELFRANLQQ